jgi:ABC-type branched-subunit amino acid transport system substrate-binding protein
VLLFLVVLAGTAPDDSLAEMLSSKQIIFGQSAALTGPARLLGQSMRLGLFAAFREANRTGGVHNYRLILESLDDAYEPEVSINNAREFIERRNVFALIGSVGTPASAATQPLATERGVPYIAPLTGAEFLRVAQLRPNVVNVRASYYQETEEMVVRLTEDLGVQRIGVLYQNDSSGRAGLNGLRRAVARHGLSLVAEADYPRNTEAIKIALLDLRRSRPEAIVIIGTYRPAAALIRWSRRLNFNPYFVNISVVGSTALARELGSDGAGVYVTQVVPFPRDTSLPVVAEYQSALARMDPETEPDFVSLEGYLAGRLVVEGLRLAGPRPTRQGFLQALQAAETIDLGGFLLRYGDADNQGSDRVYLTVIDEQGRVQPVSRMAP